MDLSTAGGPLQSHGIVAVTGCSKEDAGYSVPKGGGMGGRATTGLEPVDVDAVQVAFLCFWRPLIV